MKKFILNPPWVDSLLEDNWDELASAVGQSMLPFAVTKPPSGGRRGRVTVAPGAELGCGHYGCVMATRTAGVVCKITSDRSEAEFVEAAWKIFGRDWTGERGGAPGWPKGIVRYYKIVGLTGAEHRSSAYSSTVAHSGPTDRAAPREAAHGPSGAAAAPLWMLWRDEVDHIGRPPGDAAFVLDIFRLYARQVREALSETDEDLTEAVALWRRGGARVDAGRLEAIGDDMPRLRALASLDLPPVRRLAVCLEMASRAIDGLDDLPTVRDALRVCLDHGLLLADVHKDNVGRGTRGGAGWVITDPGHFVSLAPRRTARGTRLP